MLVIPGRAARTCEGWSRRDWLRVGALGASGLGSLGLGTGELLTGRAVASPSKTSDHAPGFGRARACIVLFLFGAPAHQDTWDLKPDGPAEVRGEFAPIETSARGMTISEHLPLLATRAHHLTQLRAVTHPDNTHTVAMHYMLTGVRHKRPATNPRNAADDFPCFGAVMNYVESLKERAGRSAPARSLPSGISLNAPANQVSASNHIFPGFFSGLLGAGHDPLFVPNHADQPDFAPFTAVDAVARLIGRRDLRVALGDHARSSASTDSSANAQSAGARIDGCYERAFQLLTSSEARSAFEVSRESTELRQKYGMTPFGQGCLLARRLVEAGVPLVTVNWQRDDAYWDTHADNFNLHKKTLLPNFDRGFSALLDDLADRRLLDETLIVVLGEFGRTPKINANAGRDHWAPCNTVVLAGGGVPGGQVYGASDRSAAFPARNPILPEDLAATIYHLLGVDPELPIHTPDGRRLALSSGEVLHAIL
ncbi:MAG: DUF1501 domain-containing protein [Planctomycetaceae bacterium]|nr:DUF1501 domain-containing protein [Planctomycetaceae bacterium]